MAVYSNILVWVGVAAHSGTCPRYQLLQANLRNFHPTAVWTSPACIPILDVHISRSWIVWLSGQDPAGTIWAMDRRTGRVTKVAAQPYNAANHPCLTLSCVPTFSFSLTGNTVVWSHFDLGTEPDWMVSSIRSRSLPHGRVRTLYLTQAHCELETAPQLSGTKLAWTRVRWPRDVALAMVPSQQCEGPLQSNVMTKRIGSRRAWALTADGQSGSPETNGQVIVWLTSSSSTPFCACFALDLEVPRQSKARLVASNVSSAVIGPTFLAWLTSTGSGTTLTARDLATRRQEVVASSGPLSSSTFLRAIAWTEGPRLVWERDAVLGAYSARAIIGVQDLR